MTLAQKVRNHTRGTIVTFKKGSTIRIATKKGLIFDFSYPRGTLSEDLFKRDFTINAIAWSPYEGIIDPFMGIDDINKKCIRLIHEKNLTDDPLRMLRAYRLAAELNGFVSQGTRKLIKILNNNIKETASERITLELFNLLNLKHSSKYLNMAFYDGLLSNIFIISNKQLQENIKEISLFEKLTFNKIPSTIKVKLKDIFSQNLTYKGLLCLSLLIKNILKSEESSYRLKLSRKIERRIRLINLDMANKITKGKNFDLYTKAKDASIDILLLRNRLDCLGDYKRYLGIWDKGIISSGEVIRYTGNLSGKDIGNIIKEIKKAEYEGRVRSKSSLEKFVNKLTDNISDNCKS